MLDQVLNNPVFTWGFTGIFTVGPMLAYDATVIGVGLIYFTYKVIEGVVIEWVKIK